MYFNKIILFFVALLFTTSGCHAQKLQTLKTIEVKDLKYEVTVYESFNVTSITDKNETDKIRAAKAGKETALHMVDRWRIKPNVDIILQKAEQLFGHLNYRDLELSLGIKNDNTILTVSYRFSNRLDLAKEKFMIFQRFVNENLRVTIDFPNERERELNPVTIYSFGLMSRPES